MESLFGMQLTNQVYRVLMEHTDRELNSNEIAEYVLDNTQVELNDAERQQFQKRIQIHLRVLSKTNKMVERKPNLTDLKTIYYTYKISTN